MRHLSLRSLCLAIRPAMHNATPRLGDGKRYITLLLHEIYFLHHAPMRFDMSRYLMIIGRNRAGGMVEALHSEHGRCIPSRLRKLAGDQHDFLYSPQW